MQATKVRVAPDGIQRSNTRAFFVTAGYKGGEGTLLLNAAPHGYWKETIFAWAGRPLPPVLITAIYFIYVVLVTVVSEIAMPEVAGSVAIDGITISSVGGCLFFLLVFRSNAAYDRWWEGRKKWGMVINRTRDLARQSICYMGDGTPHVDTMVRYIIAFAVTMKRHLRGERELTELARKLVLSQEQIIEIQSAKHMPLIVLEKLSSTIRAAKREGLLSDIEAMALDANLTQYEDDLGACERILKTKMPFAYIIHLRFFLIMWLLALPFALVAKVQWGAIPVAMAILFALVGLEMIGVEIENPFGHDYNDLPLDSITDDTICANLMELLKRHEAKGNPVKTTGEVPIPETPPTNDL